MHNKFWSCTTHYKKALTLPNDKILGVTELKAFADDKMKVTEKINLFWKC